MYQRAGTVSFHASEYCSSGNIQLPALLDNRAVKRFFLPFVILAKMNAQHLSLARKFHCRVCFLLSSSWKLCVYLMTSTSDKTTSPCCTMSSSTNRKARSLSSLSTTDNMIGRSCERWSAESL